MDKRQNLELIADISNANGAPGFEDDVVAQIRRHAEGLGELRETVFAIFIFTAKKTKETVRWYSWTDTVMRLLSWYRQSVLTETSALSPWAAG